MKNNGIKTINGKEWHLLTNFDLSQRKHAQIAADYVNMEYFIDENAIDMFGNKMEGCLALWVPQKYFDDNKKDDDKIHKYFLCTTELSTQFKKRLERHGIPHEILKGLYIYVGCEKEYFPGFSFKKSNEENRQIALEAFQNIKQ